MTLGEYLEKEGKRRGKFEVTQNMLAENFDLSLIKKMTGLADEEIETLIQKH